MAREMAQIPQQAAPQLGEAPPPPPPNPLFPPSPRPLSYDATLLAAYHSLGFSPDSSSFPFGTTVEAVCQRVKAKYHIPPAHPTSAAPRTDYWRQCNTPLRKVETRAMNSDSTRASLACSDDIDLDGDSSSKGLKSLTARIVEILTDYSTISHKKIAEILSDEIYVTGESERRKEERRIKRRVYDVVNILAAVGVVRKTDKEVSVISRDNAYFDVTGLEKKLTEKQANVCEKRDQLRTMARNLVSIYALIDRNRKSVCNRSETLPFPILLLATRDSSENSVTHSQVHLVTNQANTTLLAKFRLPMAVLGESDVLLRLPIPTVGAKQVPRVLTHPGLRKYVDLPLGDT